MARRDEPTPAQRNAANDAAQGRPPAHEQYPLSEREQRLVEEAEERRLNGDKR